MAKILGLNGRALASTLPEPPTPVQVATGLKALLTCRSIGLDAYCLGMMVCAQAQTAEVREVTCSHDIARRIVVKAQGQVFSGPVGQDRLCFVQAMQELHFLGGVLSHYDPELLNEFDAAERHFSLSPEVGSDAKWDAQTPISFRLPAMTQQDYNSKIGEAFTGKMSGVAGSLTLDLLRDVAQRH
jgi:hypothetical protein